MNIRLTAQLHRNHDCILIDAPTAANRLLKKISGIKYSKKQQSWYTPLSREYFLAIIQTLQHIASIDHEPLKAYLHIRRQLQQSRQAGQAYSNTQPQTSNPKQQITNIKPQTSNPKPQYLKSTANALYIQPCN